MKNTQIQLMKVAILSLFIYGCGGSEGGSSSNEDSQASVVESSEEAVLIATVEMDDLLAEEDFNFTSKNQIEVSLSLADYQYERGYISIYSGYQQLDSGDYYPDSTSRVIAGAVVAGEFAQSFVSSTNNQQYLLEIWSYDGQPPMQKELFLQDNKLIWD
jgi:hypothetical protein